jgi:outer membrane protein W
MKRIFVVLLIVAILPFKAFSQISQGSIVVGGSLGLSVEKEKTKSNGNTEDGPTSSTFKILPDVEYFISDNLSIGLGIGYSFNKSTEDQGLTEYTYKTGTFYLNPYLKKYFTLGDKAYFWGQAQIGMGFGTRTTEAKTGNITTSVDNDFSSLAIGITPGFRFDVTERIGLEAGIGFIGYTGETTKSGSGNNEVKRSTNKMGFEFDPSYLTFGIRYTLK